MLQSVHPELGEHRQRPASVEHGGKLATYSALGKTLGGGGEGDGTNNAEGLGAVDTGKQPKLGCHQKAGRDMTNQKCLDASLTSNCPSTRGARKEGPHRPSTHEGSVKERRGFKNNSVKKYTGTVD